MQSNSGRMLSTRSLVIQAYVWLALPVVIFLATWFRLWIAIPAVVILAAALFRALFRNKPGRYSSEGFKRVRIDRTFIAISAVLLLYTAFSGIGGLWYQYPGDASFRNAIFFDLVRRPWPVVYNAPGEPSSILCYYIGFWLPAALVSKLCMGKMLPGDLFQLLYAFWGLLLVVSLIFSLTGNRRRWLAFLILLFFAGGDAILCPIFDGDSYSGWMGYLLRNKNNATQYYSFATAPTLLFYIYNQGIPTMLGCLLLWFERRRTGLLVLVSSLLFLSAPMPCVGLFPVIAVALLRDVRGSLTWENAAGLMAVVLTGCYFLANNNASHTMLAPAHPWYVILGRGAIWYLLCVGVYLPFAWKRCGRSPEFWILSATALIAPCFSMGGAEDIGWRMSLPLSIFMMVAVADTACHVRRWRSARNVAFAAVLAYGAVTPAMFYVSDVAYAMQDMQAGRPRKHQWRCGRLNDPADPYYNNFVADGESPYTLYMMPRRDTPGPKQ